MLMLCERVRLGLCTHKEGAMYFVTEDTKRHAHTFLHATHTCSDRLPVLDEIREDDTKSDVKVVRKSALRERVC